ncbi:hypothetical protein DV712_14255 [Parageobacillus thermoglucosidasius]|uniref:hypothetical protein n=1 Tax=Parageobacillus thermoglucosidasius TaxID=1426 RepID=UPI000E148FB2|nr:hypothetical protein [Parageobacillus thermoglucosidasius]RDE21290.1 hypothetical protein DV712_14255 [Parageobacillus thermoglucosidasius]
MRKKGLQITNDHGWTIERLQEQERKMKKANMECWKKALLPMKDTALKRAGIPGLFNMVLCQENRHIKSRKILKPYYRTSFGGLLRRRTIW